MRNYLAVYLAIICVFFTQLSWAKSHHPQEFLQSIQGSANEGEQIYTHFCVNCHAKKPIIPVGAPRIGEDNEWSDRLKKDISVVLKNTNEGINAMPPRGGCFECTDNQLILAILFMVPKLSIKKADS
jgi:cytochrome c5